MLELLTNHISAIMCCQGQRNLPFTPSESIVLASSQKVSGNDAVALTIRFRVGNTEAI